MEHIFANRVLKVKPSATLAISARAMQLKKEGQDIINLSVGEPDFDTPQHIKKAAILAIENGQTKYTPVSGIPELRQAIAKKFDHDNGLTYQPSQIVVTNGAKQAIFNALQVLLNPGDEVVVPTPYWVSYSDMVLLSDAKPVFVEGSFNQHFKITAEQLHQAITPKTKLVMFNSPSNPTGVTYTAAEWQAFGEVLRKHPHVYILCDDIYEKIYWGEEAFTNFLMENSDFYDRTIVVNGVSKTYAMTGWRIGYVAGPEPLIKMMADVQSHATSNASSISQAAALAALSSSQEFVDQLKMTFKERHDFVLEQLNQIPGIHCLPAQGAFYLFPNVEVAMAKNGFATDFELAEFILEKAFVAVVPGTAFGAKNFLRISTALSLEQLSEATQRIKKLFKS